MEVVSLDLMIMIAGVIVCLLLILLSTKTFGSFCTIYDSYGSENVCTCKQYAEMEIINSSRLMNVAN